MRWIYHVNMEPPNDADSLIWDPKFQDSSDKVNHAQRQQLPRSAEELHSMLFGLPLRVKLSTTHRGTPNGWSTCRTRPAGASTVSCFE